MARKQYEVPKDTIGLLSTPQPRRGRDWDEAHQTEIHTYRGIPEGLHQEVKEIAGQVGVNVGEVARAFLEHGIKVYRQGRLRLDPVIVETKKTLYPEKEGE